jgi:hypothetical protein
LLAFIAFVEKAFGSHVSHFISDGTTSLAAWHDNNTLSCQDGAASNVRATVETERKVQETKAELVELKLSRDKHEGVSTVDGNAMAAQISEEIQSKNKLLVKLQDSLPSDETTRSSTSALCTIHAARSAGIPTAGTNGHARLCTQYAAAATGAEASLLEAKLYEAIEDHSAVEKFISGAASYSYLANIEINGMETDLSMNNSNGIEETNNSIRPFRNMSPTLAVLAINKFTAEHFVKYRQQSLERGQQADSENVTVFDIHKNINVPTMSLQLVRVASEAIQHYIYQANTVFNWEAEMVRFASNDAAEPTSFSISLLGLNRRAFITVTVHVPDDQMRWYEVGDCPCGHQRRCGIVCIHLAGALALLPEVLAANPSLRSFTDTATFRHDFSPYNPRFASADRLTKTWIKQYAGQAIGGG